MSIINAKAPEVKVSEVKASEAKVKLVHKKTSEKVPVVGTYGTGRRKNAIAKVWLRPGNGKVVVNKKLVDLYFAREFLRKYVTFPLTLTKTLEQYDVVCTVLGGGLSGQAGAIVHGLSRALDKAAPEFHTLLKQNRLLTRDSRIVERKKYGLHKARKSTQFSKR